ncbi:MAG: SRPBCC family protein [Pseudomonadota bacterium]
MFSLGLGLTQMLAPETVARLIGLPDKRGTRLVIRLIGARELASGLGLLGRREPAAWAWGRAAGDVMDLALLGRALTSLRPLRPRTAAAAAVVAGAAAVDAVSAARLMRGPKVSQVIEPIHVVKSITVNRPPEEVYKFWRDLENLPRFMSHLESVQVTNGRSVWKAKGPAGMSVEWQAEVVFDRPYESIGWKSVEGSTLVPNRHLVTAGQK